MGTLDYKQIVSECLAAAKTELGKSWKSFKPYAEHEFRQFAENAEFLAHLKLAGTIENEELKARLEIQRLALKNVLLTMRGIGLVTAQNTVNAVLKIVGEAVSKMLEVALPV